MHHFSLLACILAIFFSSAYAMAAPAASPEKMYCAPRELDMMPFAERPVYDVSYFGAKGDGVTDDTKALQWALDQTPSGAVLAFPEGTYLHSNSLILSKNGTILWGQGGILKATNPKDQALVLKGNRTAAVGMILHGTGNKRSSQPETTKIKVIGRWVQVLGNMIDGGTSGGIFVYGGKDFRIEENEVRNTLADGIHMTAGARRGIVRNNSVHDTGDDMIAVVSYANQADNGSAGYSGDILIRNNTVARGPWGRGITVVGGENVAITGNTITGITHAAGILISQEKPSKTGGVRNVLIKDNNVNNIILPEIADPRKYTGQGAIDINSYNEYPLEYIDVLDNAVSESRFAGVRVLGKVCHVRIANNTLTHVAFQRKGKDPIHIINDPCAPETVTCWNNTADGAAILPSDKVCVSSEDAFSGEPSFDYGSLEKTVWQECR